MYIAEINLQKVLFNFSLSIIRFFRSNIFFIIQFLKSYFIPKDPNMFCQKLYID